LEFLTDQFNGLLPTCELLEVALQYHAKTSGFCLMSQLYLKEYCGCGATKGSKPVVHDPDWGCKLCAIGEVPDPNKLIEMEGFPFPTCGKLETATKTVFSNTSIYCSSARLLNIHCGCQPEYDSPCTACEEGYYPSSQVPLPQKILDPVITGPILPGIRVTCKIVNDIANGLPSREEVPEIGGNCAAAQGIATECGCPKPKEASKCQMCSVPLDIKYYNHWPVTLNGYEPFTCHFMELMDVFSQDNDGIVFGDIDIQLDCRFIKSVGYICGCNDGVFPYWGANTLLKQKETNNSNLPNQYARV
jgi:hypothetical protein